MLAKYYTKKKAVVSEVVEGEVVLLDIEGDIFYQLSRVARRIWDLCENNSPVEIAATLCSEFNVTQEQASKDVHKYLMKLVDLGLLKAGSECRKTSF